MALIECPKCKGSISDKAKKCVHCGYSFEQSEGAVDGGMEESGQVDSSTKNEDTSDGCRSGGALESSDKATNPALTGRSVKNGAGVKGKLSKPVVAAICAAVVFLLVAFASVLLVCPHDEWRAATCTEPKSCIKCGLTEGKALGHEWAEATCTEPQKCIRCNATKGEPIAHKFGDYTLEKEATYSEEGKETAVCEMCGGIASRSIPKAESFSLQVGDGDYPFAVDEADIRYARILNPAVKHTSDYPYQVVFHSGDNLDEPNELVFEVGDGRKCAYAVEVTQVETVCIDVEMPNGQTEKAFVNTELSLSNAPSNWGQNNALYLLEESGSCYMFQSEIGTILAIKDIVSGNGYLMYAFW